MNNLERELRRIVSDPQYHVEVWFGGTLTWDAERGWLKAPANDSGSFYYATFEEIEGERVPVVNKFYAGKGWSEKPGAPGVERGPNGEIFIHYRTRTAVEPEPPFARWWTTGKLTPALYKRDQTVYFVLASQYHHGCLWPTQDSVPVVCRGTVDSFHKYADGFYYEIRDMREVKSGKRRLNRMEEDETWSGHPANASQLGRLVSFDTFPESDLYRVPSEAEASLMWKAGDTVTLLRPYYTDNLNDLVLDSGAVGILNEDVEDNTVDANFSSAHITGDKWDWYVPQTFCRRIVR